MAIRTFDEFSERLREYVGDRDDDASLEIIEDFSDSRTEWEPKEDWKSKYDELDRSWRERYKKRFYSAEDRDTPDARGPMRTDEEVIEEKRSFDELFKEE